VPRLPPEEVCDRIHGRLARIDSLEPIGPADEELFGQFDLASLVENRLGVILEPEGLDDRARQRWAPRVTEDPRSLTWGGSEFARGYWIVHGGQRVGTIAVWTSCLGSEVIRVDSLFVSPRARRSGVARQALLAVHQSGMAEGLAGIRLETEWCWQGAVRFYVAIGMWVRGWKRSLDFVWRRELPAYHVEGDRDAARFVLDDGRPPIEARREGDRLAWRESKVDPLAPGTFALALALDGFPLLRSEEAWRRQLDQGFSDFGGPEGLAFKIQHWEAWARKHDWRVDTPRIPGLDMPDWEAFLRRATEAGRTGPPLARGSRARGDF
jgi:GNAT superfamily N-acetyltransferase